MPVVKNLGTALAEGLAGGAEAQIAARRQAEQDALAKRQAEANIQATEEQTRVSKEKSEVEDRNRKVQYLQAVQQGAQKALASGTLNDTQKEQLKNWSAEVDKVVNATLGFNPDYTQLNRYEELSNALSGLGGLTIDGLAVQGGWTQRRTEAEVAGAETQVELQQAQLDQIQRTAESTIAKINTENNVATARGRIVEDLLDFEKGLARADYLSKIATSGEIGQQVVQALVADGKVDKATLDAFNAKAGRVIAGEKAGVAQAEGQAALTDLQVKQVQATAKSTIDVINSTNDLKVIQNKVESDLNALKGAGQRAAYLKAISDTGANGAAVIQQLLTDKKITQDEFAASQKMANLVTQQAEYTVASLGTALETAKYNLQTILPLQARGLAITNDNGELQVEQTRFALEQAKDLAPTVKRKALAELGIVEAQQKLSEGLLQLNLDKSKSELVVDMLNKLGTAGLDTLERMGYITDENRGVFEDYAFQVDEVRAADVEFKQGQAQEQTSRAYVAKMTEDAKITTEEAQAGIAQTQEKLVELQMQDFEAKMPESLKALQLSNALSQANIDLAAVNLTEVRTRITAMQQEIDQKGQQFPEQLAYLQAQKKVLELQAQLVEATQAGEIEMKNLTNLYARTKLDPTAVDKYRDPVTGKPLTDKQKNLIRNLALAERDVVFAESDIKDSQARMQAATAQVAEEEAKQAVIATKFANQEAQAKINEMNQRIASMKNDDAYKIKQMELAYAELEQKKLMNASERAYMQAQIANLNAQTAYTNAKKLQESNNQKDKDKLFEALKENRISADRAASRAQTNLKDTLTRYLPKGKFDINQYTGDIRTVVPNFDELTPDVQKAIQDATAAYDQANYQVKAISNALLRYSNGEAIDLDALVAGTTPGSTGGSGGSGAGGAVLAFPKTVNQKQFNQYVLNLKGKDPAKAKTDSIRLVNKLIAAGMKEADAKKYVNDVFNGVIK